MNLDAITTDLVRDALRAARSASPLADSPLLHLRAVTQGLVDEHLADTPTARAAYLVRWLEALAWERLAALRGEASPGRRPAQTAEAALTALIADFQARNADREAWAVLHFHSFTGSSLTRRDLAAVLGLGYNTVRRRIERGHALLVELLREREQAADAVVSRGRGVPRPLTRFIGRESELAAIRGLMAEHRLVTLTGPGGIGKSRLAIHLAQDLAADYPDGAWFVEVAALSEEQQVPRAVLSTFGLSEAPGISATRSLAERLAARRLLLVVDNCEHLVGACSALIGHLLQHCDALQVLVTSRETLFVDGGAVWSVPPMALPLEPSTAPAASLMHFDAPRLFSARAAAARPGFQLDDANAARVGAICGQLDGIPLAIELAAALTRYLSLEQIEWRLVDRFALLRDGHHASRSGHETLEAAMDWSYQLLSEPERLLLRRLAVFSGGWTLEAAEAVCAGDGIAEGDVLALLTQLEVKSLVTVSLAGGARRFGMLETVRQYALRRLVESGAEAVSRDAHARYFAAFAKEAEHGLEGRGDYDWLLRLDQEQPNIQSAFEWIIAQGEFELGSRLARSLGSYWDNRGGWTEVRRLLRALLACDAPPSVSQARADTLGGAATLAMFQSDFDEAKRCLEECLEILQAIGSPRDLGRLYNSLAIVAEDGFNDLEEARGYYDAALSASRSAGDDRTMSAALCNLGLLWLRLGDPTQGRCCIEQSLAIDRGRGDLESVSVSLQGMGHACRDLGQLEMARSHYQESVRIGRELDSPRLVSAPLAHLGSLAYHEGDWRAAAQACEESAALSRTAGDQKGLSGTLAALGQALVPLGECSRARQLLEESISISAAEAYQGELATAFEVLAQLEAALGNSRRAARLLGAARKLREGARLRSTNLAAAAVDRTLADVDQALGHEAGAAALAEGQDLAPAQTVAYALGEVTWEALHEVSSA